MGSTILLYHSAKKRRNQGSPGTLEVLRMKGKDLEGGGKKIKVRGPVPHFHESENLAKGEAEEEGET